VLGHVIHGDAALDSGIDDAVEITPLSTKMKQAVL
jgi:hypothetical protein